MPNVPILSLEERKKLFQNFENWLEQEKFSDSKKALLQILWFFVHHENSFIMHPQVLVYSFSELVTDAFTQSLEAIGSVLRRINDPKDFNQLLSKQQFTREDVIKAYQDMSAFARSQVGNKLQ